MLPQLCLFAWVLAYGEPTKNPTTRSSTVQSDTGCWAETGEAEKTPKTKSKSWKAQTAANTFVFNTWFQFSCF